MQKKVNKCVRNLLAKKPHGQIKMVRVLAKLKFNVIIPVPGK